jgi:glycosyltransferase involved in cell wall biosynthesis
VTWKIQPQIIHAVLESFAGLALIFSRPLVPRAKTILTCQSTNTSFLVRFMHRHVDRVVVISRALVQRAQKFGRTDALLIPNGIDVRAIGRACSEASKVPGRILFVGRLEPMKGVDTLLRAFARLREETAAGAELPFRAHMRIVGCGSNERALKRLSADLGIADDVTFVGFVPIPRVYQEFAEAQIFCGLSRSEALGNVFLEAQAAGCAVIATRTGGIPDIVEDGRTGLLVPPDDAAVAARALRELLSDPRRWAELARAGLAHVQTYDWSGIVARYAELYRTLLM